MRVKFKGKTNEFFEKGKIYDAVKIEELKNFSFFNVMSGDKIVKFRSDAFNRDFVEHKEVAKEARYTGVDDSWFTYGKVYKFVKEKDLSNREYMRVDINSMSILPVDMEFFDNNFKVLSGDTTKAQKQYVIFVQGGQAPKKVHYCPALAEQEAKRLASKTQNIGKTVYVMEVKKMLKSKVIIEDV